MDKKRKRVESDNEDALHLTVFSQNAAALGPVLTSFSGVVPPRSTAFKSYVKRDKLPHDSSSSLLIGSSDRIEYSSEMSEGGVPHICEYVIGIRDKTTSVLTLRRVPMYVVNRRVKALEALSVAASTAEWSQARNTLGETFGTKKAKAAIRASERNRVNISAMEDVVPHMQDSIQAKTVTLPSQEKLQATTHSNRPIPPFNAAATSLLDVYALEDLISDSEMNSFSFSLFQSATTDKELISILPHQRSSWINAHMRSIFAASKFNKANLKILFYISCMLAFKRAAQSVGDRAVLQDRLPAVPIPILEGLLSKFTETPRGSTKPQVTPFKEMSLLMYMFALCLRIDNFVTDSALIANDLNLPATQVNQYFKSLGCQIDSPGAGEREKLGLSVEESKQIKRAILRLPLRFPSGKLPR